MATQEFYLSFLTGSDAAFRAWINTWHTKLAAIGLVRLTEGSPIDKTTVTRPVGSNNLTNSVINLGSDVVAGTDIWRFDDALQGTKPVFIKFYYSVHGYNPFSYAYDASDGTYGKNAKIRLYFEVGQATDGAGNLQGQKTLMREIATGFLINESYAANQTDYSITPSAFNTYNQVLMSGNAGRLSVMFGANHPADGWTNYGSYDQAPYYYPNSGHSEARLSPMLNIERSKNADGSDNGDAICILQSSFSNAGGGNDASSYNFTNKGNPKSQVYFPFGEAPQTLFFEFSSLANLGKGNTIDSIDGRLSALPILNFDNGLMKNPFLGMIGSMNPDFAVGINSINVFGSNRNYRKPENKIRSSQGNQARDTFLMILWE